MKPLAFTRYPRKPAFDSSLLRVRARGNSAAFFLGTIIHEESYHTLSATPTTFLLQRRWQSAEPTTSESSDATITSDDKKYKCPMCTKQFLGKLALENHMHLRHNQRPVSAARIPVSRGNFTPQSFESLIDGYDARKIERIDRKKYSKQPLIINGKPETEEERKERLKRVIEEREQFRHKSVSVTDIPLVLDLVAAWDSFALKLEAERNKDLEEGEFAPPPHVRYNPLTLEEIKEYIKNRKDELGYDEDAHSWMSDGIPLSVFKVANEKKVQKQTEELKKIHFGSRQLGSMSEPNPYKQSQTSEVSDLPFKCPKCGKGYRSKMSMEFHYNSICVGKEGEAKASPEQSAPTDTPTPSTPAVVESPPNPFASGQSAASQPTPQYVEGAPQPPTPAPEAEREFFEQAEKQAAPPNPFKNSDQSPEKVDAPSFPEEWQTEEVNESLQQQEARAAEHTVEESQSTHTTSTAPNPFAPVDHGITPPNMSVLCQSVPRVNNVRSSPSVLKVSHPVGTTNTAENPFATGQASSSVPNPFAKASQHTSSAVNPFERQQPVSNIENPFRKQNGDSRPKANVTSSENSVEGQQQSSAHASANSDTEPTVTQVRVEHASNPFKQAALDEQAARREGKEVKKGLLEESEFKKVLEKLPKESNPGESVNTASQPSSGTPKTNSETCDAVLQGTVSAQHHLLQKFTHHKKEQQNPFKIFSGAPARAVEQATFVPSPANKTVGKMKSQNPFAHFSTKTPYPSASTAQRQNPLPNTTQAIPASNPPNLFQQTTTQSRTVNPFATSRAPTPPQPTPNPFANTGAPNPFAKHASSVNPFQQQPQQPANPFFRDAPPIQNKATIDQSSAQNSAASTRPSKPTCPQCGMTFRLQAALDAHVASSHTVASSLYASDSGTNASEENPFQPGNVVPIIPEDPFA